VTAAAGIVLLPAIFAVVRLSDSLGGTHSKSNSAIPPVDTGASATAEANSGNVRAEPSAPLTTGGRSSLGSSLVNDIRLTPLIAQIASGNHLVFSARVSGTNDMELIWSVKEGDLGGRVVARGARASAREVSFQAVYIAPSTPGTYHVVVSTKGEPYKSAIAEVTVTARTLSPSTKFEEQRPQSNSPYH